MVLVFGGAKTVRIQCFWRYIIAIYRVRMILKAKALAKERERRLKSAIFIQRIFKGSK